MQRVMPRNIGLGAILLLFAALASGISAHADFFAETAVQTHRGTHLDDPGEYSGNGVFEANQGVGQTSTETTFDFVDDQVLGSPPDEVPIREEFAFGSANLATGELNAQVTGAQRSDIFAFSRSLAAIKDRMVVGRPGGPPFGTLNNDVVTFTLTLDGSLFVDNPTAGSSFNNSIFALIVGKPGSITPFLAFQSPDYYCTFYYGIGADADVIYNINIRLPLAAKFTSFPVTITASCPVQGDFDWAITLRPSYVSTAPDTFWDFNFANTLEYGVFVANGGQIDSTDSGITPPEGLPPPPSAPLDHYLSYKTKVTKGANCTPDAPSNANKACTTEEECGGVSEGDNETAYCVAEKFPKGLRATLSDRLEPGSRLYDITKPLTLLTPAQKFDEPINDPDTHLRGYAIKLTPKQCTAESTRNLGGVCTKEVDCGGTDETSFCRSQTKSVKQPGVIVRNQFHNSESGALVIDVVKPDRLLVPASKGLTEPLEPPVGVDVDHYKCYKVVLPKGVKFTPITSVSVQDQFTEVQTLTGKKLFDLKKPAHLCMVATKNAEAVVDPTQNLFCYQALPTKGQPKHVAAPGLYLSTQFDVDQVDTVKEDEFCVPSEVDLPASG